MHSLTDESFHSLPIPHHLHKLMLLHDVADVVCKAFQMWPKLMTIEDLMSLLDEENPSALVKS